MIDCWINEPAPPTNKPNWYAVLMAFPENEGIFPQAMFWEGSNWKDEPFAIVAYSGPFESEEEAAKWADDNDPDFCSRSGSIPL